MDLVDDRNGAYRAYALADIEPDLTRCLEQPGPLLEELAGQTRQMTRRHPWYAALYHTRPPAGPHMMERLEFMLAVLTAQGASTAEAMTYAAMIDRYILGSALQDTEEARMSREHGLDDEATLRSAMNAVHDLAAATGNARFDRRHDLVGLDVDARDRAEQHHGGGGDGGELGGDLAGFGLVAGGDTHRLRVA